MPAEFEEFTPEELKYLNLTLRRFPNVAHGLRAVVSVTARLSFPVEGPEALREVIAATGIRYGESEIPVESLPDLMPEYYFPIESEEDFVTKVADVAARQREPQGPNMPGVVLSEATASQRSDPPDISDDQFFEMIGRAAKETAPSIAGLVKHKRDDG